MTMARSLAGPGWRPRGPRLALVLLAQGMNLVLVVGGIVTAVGAAFRLQDLPSVYRGPVDGDVLRGYGIGILGGLALAKVAAVAIVAIALRLRAGCVIDVLLWAGLWWPSTVAVSILTPSSYPISTAVCVVGELIGTAGFWAMSRPREQQAHAERAEATQPELREGP